MKRPGVIALLLLLAACNRTPGLDKLAPGESGRVAEVKSGDTLVLASGLEVRLAGVEAPRDDPDAARQALTDLRKLADGRDVMLLYGGLRRDVYGRALAQVERVKGGLWIQGALLRAGDVRERTWPDNRAMAEPMLEAEAYARNRRIGLWKLPAFQVLPPARAAYATGFQVVEGRVRRTGDGGDWTTLDFGGGRGLAFGAEIPARALGDFRVAAKAPEQLRGRLVRVRGRLRDGADGSVMRLDHPEQIELLKDG